MGRSLPKILTEQETDSLLSQPNTRWFSPHRDKLLFRLMLGAGLRVGEAVSVKRTHLSMQSCKLLVRDGKGAKDRTVWISEDLRDSVGEFLERDEISGDQWLLPTRKGTRVRTAHVRRSLKRYAKEAGIEEVGRVSPHTLRHTFATRLLRETGNIRLVQKALGHEDLSTTMIYTHIVDEELEAAMKAFSG